MATKFGDAFSKTAETGVNVVEEIKSFAKDFEIGKKEDKKNFKSLDQIKKDFYEGNPYLQLMETLKIKPTPFQKKAAYINSIATGHNKFYRDVIFQDTINDMSKKFANELFSGVKFTFNLGEDTKVIEQGDLVQSELYNVAINVEDIPLIKLAEEGMKYSKVALKINIEDGKYKFEVLPPFRYTKVNDNRFYINYITKDNDLLLEQRSVEDGTLIITEQVENSQKGASKPVITEIPGIDNPLIFEVKFATYTPAGIEKIKEYDLLCSNITAEVAKNQSKIFGDKRLFKDNPINTDYIQTLDIPESSKALGDSATSSAMMNVVSSKHSLTDLIAAKNEKSTELVTHYGLSKKVLAMDSSQQDFASSLPYENDMTAKTINEARRKISSELEKILFILLGKPINLEMGKYKLVSQDAITSNNQKANGFRSLRRKVALELDKDISDSDVLLETWRIKNELDIPTDFEEDQAAIEAGLIPNLGIEIGD